MISFVGKKEFLQASFDVSQFLMLFYLMVF